MSALIDLTGRTFGRLKVLRRAPNKGKMVYWLCRCICGKTKEIQGSHLKNGSISSCGCFNSEITRRRNYKHGEGIDGKTSQEYRAWMHMKGRCLIPSDKSYKDYGGRGIKVCERWMSSFQNFLDDMGRCPKGYSLEREDVNGDYEPENCKWVSLLVQASNTRKNVYLSAFGETHHLAEWARQLGVAYGAIKYHLARGRTMEEVVGRFRSRSS